MACGVTALCWIQRVSQKGLDVCHRLRAVLEQIEDGRGSGIQQVRVPGTRLEDDAIIVEHDDTQALRGFEAWRGRRLPAGILRHYALISDV